MVLDVVPNSKMLLGLPSASNKIAGHPERLQEEKGDCFPHRPPALSNSSVLLNHQLSLGCCAVLAGPNLASIFTPYCMPCLHPTVSGVLAPRVLGYQVACRKPLLYNQVICPSPAKDWGEIVTYLLWLPSEKKWGSLGTAFLSFTLMLSRCGVSPRVVNILHSGLSRTQITRKNHRMPVTLWQDLKLRVFYNFHIFSPFFPLCFISLHQESKKIISIGGKR